MSSWRAEAAEHEHEHEIGAAMAADATIAALRAMVAELSDALSDALSEIDRYSGTSPLCARAARLLDETLRADVATLPVEQPSAAPSCSCSVCSASACGAPTVCAACGNCARCDEHALGCAGCAGETGAATSAATGAENGDATLSTGAPNGDRADSSAAPTNCRYCGERRSARGCSCAPSPLMVALGARLHFGTCGGRATLDDALVELQRELRCGDLLVLPNGTTATVTFDARNSGERWLARRDYR